MPVAERGSGVEAYLARLGLRRPQKSAEIARRDCKCRHPTRGRPQLPMPPSGTRSTDCLTAARCRRSSDRWTGRGRPANGYLTKRTAEDWLGSVRDQTRRGTLPGMVRTGATCADAAAEWLRYIEHDRGRKPSTVAGYRSIVGSELLPRFGTMA